MLFPKSILQLRTYLQHQHFTLKIWQSAKRPVQGNCHLSILRILSLENTQQIIWLWLTMISVQAGVSPLSFPSVPSPFIRLIHHFITLSNVLKEWKPIKMRMEKSDSLDQIAMPSDLRNLQSEYRCQTSMGNNSSNWWPNTLKLSQDGFHPLNSSVCI